MTELEKLMSIFEGFDIEQIGTKLPSAESLMTGLTPWMVWLVLIGPLLMLGFGLYYLFFAPKEANHTVGYRFFYAMSRVEVWQHAQRLAGIGYAVLGAALFFVIGLISLSFGSLAVPDMVWRAAKCLLWEVVLVVMVTLAVDLLIVVLYDYKGNPRKPSAKRMKSGRSTRRSSGSTRRPPAGH